MKALPLTDESIAAIRSNPLAAKKIEALVQCQKCNDKIGAYVGLEKDTDLEKKGNIWYQELPDTFECKCKKKFNLKYMKENMHALLGSVKIDEKIKGSVVRLYDDAALKNIINKFEKLMDNNPLEEKVQKFIEKNTLILQSFSPIKLFFKRPILNDYITDFCIVNNKKELLMIEIERPDTPLMKKNGHTTAKMQHAIDQVNDWLDLVKEDKSAILRSMKLKSEDVSRVKGVVILGRDKGYDKEKLRRLKGKDIGEVSFFTYDDILNGLYSLVSNINND